MTERWVWIKGYEGRYQISDYGRIKGYWLTRWGKRKDGRIRKCFKNKSGYCRITLCNNYQPKQYFIARLVAQHFISNPFNKPEVNHIDGNKENNYYKNLEWVTAKENLDHAIKYLNKNSKMRRGEKCSFSKLTEKGVSEIRALYKHGVPGYGYKAMAKQFNIAMTTVANVINRRTWKGL